MKMYSTHALTSRDNGVHTRAHAHTRQSVVKGVFFPAAAEGESNYMKKKKQVTMSSACEARARHLFKCIIERLVGPQLIKQVALV